MLKKNKKMYIVNDERVVLKDEYLKSLARPGAKALDKDKYKLLCIVAKFLRLGGLIDIGDFKKNSSYYNLLEIIRNDYQIVERVLNEEAYFKFIKICEKIKENRSLANFKKKQITTFFKEYEMTSDFDLALSKINLERDVFKYISSKPWVCKIIDELSNNKNVVMNDEMRTKLIDVVDFVLKNPMTVSKIAEMNKMGERTVSKYLNEYLFYYGTKENSNYLYTYYEVREIMKKNMKSTQFVGYDFIDPNDLAELKINNRYTNEMLAKLFGVSETNICNILRKANPDYLLLIDQQNKENKYIGSLAGGKNSGLIYDVDIEKVKEIASGIIANGWSLEETSKQTNIPICTLCAWIEKNLYYVPKDEDDKHYLIKECKTSK